MPLGNGKSKRNKIKQNKIKNYHREISHYLNITLNNVNFETGTDTVTRFVEVAKKMTRFSKVLMQNTHVFFRTWFLEL